MVAEATGEGEYESEQKATRAVTGTLLDAKAAAIRGAECREG